MRDPDDLPTYGRGAEPLTPTERARLRPTVDPEALEHFLVSIMPRFIVDVPFVRRAVIAHFAIQTTEEDLTAIGEGPSPEDDGRESPSGADGSLLSGTSLDVAFALEEPELQELWERIERPES